MLLFLGSLQEIVTARRRAAGGGGGGTASFVTSRDGFGSLGSSTVAVTFSPNLTAGNYIICTVFWGAAVTISSVQDGTSASFTAIDTDNTNRTATYRLASTAGGASASTITVTFSAADSGDNPTLLCQQWNDSGGTFTLDVHKTNRQAGSVAGTNTVTTGNVTTTGKDGCMATAETVGQSNGGFSAGTDIAWVDRHNPGQNFILQESFVQSGAGAIAGTFSATAGSDMRTTIVCLKP